jgi:hypothetical protein
LAHLLSLLRQVQELVRAPVRPVVPAVERVLEPVVLEPAVLEPVVVLQQQVPELVLQQQVPGLQPQVSLWAVSLLLLLLARL